MSIEVRGTSYCRFSCSGSHPIISCDSFAFGQQPSKTRAQPQFRSVSLTVLARSTLPLLRVVRMTVLEVVQSDLMTLLPQSTNLLAAVVIVVRAAPALPVTFRQVRQCRAPLKLQEW